MKLVSVSGVQGSGKTSLIRLLVSKLTTKGLKTSIIVNEEGEIGYDREFLNHNAVTLERLRGG